MVILPDKGLPKPDLTIFLTLDLKELGNRKGWGEERYEKEEFQKIVKSCFYEVFELEQEKGVILIIDVNGKDIKQVEDLIWEELQKKNITELTEKPIKKLV